MYNIIIKYYEEYYKNTTPTKLFMRTIKLINRNEEYRSIAIYFSNILSEIFSAITTRIIINYNQDHLYESTMDDPYHPKRTNKPNLTTHSPPQKKKDIDVCKSNKRS